MCAPDVRPFHAQRGLTLLELMVAIVISMLVALAATSGALSFSAAQRQGVTTSAATASAATTLASLKEDAAQAGLGFFGDTAYLCERLNVSFGERDLSQNPFSPVLLSRDAHGNDQLDVVYATEVAGGANVLLSVDAGPASAELRTYLPVAAGQAVLFSPAQGSAVPGCTVRTVTGVSNTTTAHTITTGSDGLHNRVAFTAPVTYPADARVTLLGKLSWNRYRVDGTNLILDQRSTGASAVVLHEVMAFRAEYGIVNANPGDTTIVDWKPATSPWDVMTPAQVDRVRALRIGVVTRSTQPEKRDRAGNCVASTESPVLWSDSITMPGADWACYRYRVSTIVVPLRNFAWGQ